TALTTLKKRLSPHSSHYSLDRCAKRRSFLYNLYPGTTALTTLKKRLSPHSSHYSLDHVSTALTTFTERTFFFLFFFFFLPLFSTALTTLNGD
ncbi:hypothetical protein, partial [Thiolapillus sp.]|uniref:hypothetical protein n=1 Tax=Thiolapillus sp. TaxID=2017437 RepID=UPI003AF969E5